ncbi:MAG: hypothetical protein JXA30_15630 [Deltaproteobacteria bacterium]|nr:hypothetical protein [Deltaproteobacteria bacterium]
MKIQLVRPGVVLLSVLFALSHGCKGGSDEKSKDKKTVEIESEDGKDRTSKPAPSLAGKQKTESAKATGRTQLIVLGDKRCTERECQIAPMIEQLKTVTPGIDVVTHDWSEAECKSLFESEGLQALPAFLFEPSIEKNSGHARISRFLNKTRSGRYLLLNTGASFDPRAEICDNKIDDTGNGLVDCQDSTCKEKLVCREEMPGRLELFVMSMCPYGTMAMDSMSEILDAFDHKIDFHIHFIASSSDKGLSSMHGQPEVDEDIRELCAIKHFPKNHRYMEYIWCRNRNIRSGDWKKCTGQKGINAAAIEKCFEGEEGKELLREDLKLAEKLGIRASPTWLANNRYLMHGIAPEAVKEQFCSHNKGLAGCEKKLSTETPKPAGVCK